MIIKKYENYWKITLAFTDIYSVQFSEILNVIINFIDKNYNIAYSDKKYIGLQQEVTKIYPKNEVSIRKVINTYVKLGFVNYRLESYHPDCLSFINEKEKEKKRTIFSKIVYSRSSFDRTVKTYSKKQEINFLLKTLSVTKSISKEELMGLMTKNIEKIKKGYLTRGELNQATLYAKSIGIKERKYNQLGHLWSIIGNLDNITKVKDKIYLKDEIADSAIEINTVTRKIRDSYLQIIFKNQLKQESETVFGSIKCMFEQLCYPPSLYIASHIKPFRDATGIEEYDVDNGLLLSKNIDCLFDQGFITFTNNGKLILSKFLKKDVVTFLKKYSLNKKLMTDKRKGYLKYHRTKIFKN